MAAASMDAAVTRADHAMGPEVAKLKDPRDSAPQARDTAHQCSAVMAGAGPADATESFGGAFPSHQA
jgi:hypothetical protein